VSFRFASLSLGEGMKGEFLVSEQSDMASGSEVQIARNMGLYAVHRLVVHWRFFVTRFGTR
jgi:hypothetical protein